jgi:hypothetical protein
VASWIVSHIILFSFVISDLTNRSLFVESLYAGVDPSKQTATSQTAYKWAFASKRTKVENDALQAARAEVGAATYGASNGPSTMPTNDRSKRVQGPTLPTQADRILTQEAAEEQAAAEREYQRKRDRAEARERLEDTVGPREVGRERMLEKKRERREGDRAFRERGDQGLEMDEGTLMGGGDSFKAQWVFQLHCSPPPLTVSTTQIHKRDARPLREIESPAEMQRVRGSSRSGRLDATTEWSVQQLSVRRTRRRWICSCRWPSKSTGKSVHISAQLLLLLVLMLVLMLLSVTKPRSA